MKPANNLLANTYSCFTVMITILRTWSCSIYFSWYTSMDRNTLLENTFVECICIQQLLKQRGIQKFKLDCCCLDIHCNYTCYACDCPVINAIMHAQNTVNFIKNCNQNISTNCRIITVSQWSCHSLFNLLCETMFPT